MVLPLLLLLGGKHFIQDKFENYGILGVLFFRMPLFKQGAFWKTVLPECRGFRTGGHSAQNAMVSKQGAFCPECHGF